MKRRTFIRNTALGVPAILQGVQAFGMNQIGMFTNLGDNDKIIVLIQLNGGNDGLNMVIPLDQYANLTAVRSNIILDESAALNLTNEVGIHPAMSKLHELYQEEKLAVIQAVGYPDQNRSHFRSKDIWMTGSASEEYTKTGWLGRSLDEDHPTYPDNFPNSDNPDPIAIAIGSSSSKTCQGTVSNFSIAVNNPANVSLVPEGLSNPDLSGVHKDRIDYLNVLYQQTNSYSEVLGKAYEKSTDHSAIYETLSENRLAQQLHIVGRLIEGGMKTKVYVVQLGGWDTHSAQAFSTDPMGGRHPILLSQLSDSIRYFQKHLEAIQKEEKVLGITFSEFGRRIASNGSDGTDHGSAAPLFVFGACAKGGILGENPTISDDIAPAEGVAMQHDFRSVYATIFRDWFELEEENISSLLTDEVQYLPFLNSCVPVVNNENIPENFVEVYPSPTIDMINIDFNSYSNEVNLSLFDARGARLKRETHQTQSSQKSQVNWYVGDLIAGIYFVRYQSGQQVRTLRFVKQ